jgi:hypothetical protein
MTFTSEVRAALDRPHRDDAAGAVHELVADAIRRLDPGARIERTDYFTHSFVPDLVVRWGSSERQHMRHVHLRFSVTAAAFQQDLDLLGDEGPLFIGMTDANHSSDFAWGEAGGSIDRTLVTQSTAIDELDAATGTDSRGRLATRQLVRVGRGVLDDSRAETVSGAYSRALESLDALGATVEQAQERVRSALALIGEYLPETGQLDVERALQSEWIRGGGDPHDFPGTTPWRPELLEPAALREVLLSLLTSGRDVRPETWQRNAGFIRVEDIGRVLGRNLHGGAFNQMAHALLPNWTAKWVWAKRAESSPLFESYNWVIEDELLGIEVGDLRAYFADDGRHFKDKEADNPLPLVTDAQTLLSEGGILEVGLRSRMEGIRYEPIGSSEAVYERLRAILAGPGASSYRLRSVRTAVPSADWEADVDLARQVIDLKTQSTPVATLVRLATRFFSRSVNSDRLDHFLATGEPPEADAAVA